MSVDTLYDESGTPINGKYRSGKNIVISLDAGVITQEEFDAKKKQLLDI